MSLKVGDVVRCHGTLKFDHQGEPIQYDAIFDPCDMVKKDGYVRYEVIE